ncbi:MAG: VWA domain-containing protein [Candidatus Methylarchaceae archaeon HK02M1]|nr:VWA domain-containing protein [Candidatus Methylarchaceae archaeon HK02M1]
MLDEGPKNKLKELPSNLNLHLLKIKGQEIASIVCKKSVSVEISDQTAYLSDMWYRTGTEDRNKIVISTKVFDCDPLQALRNFRVHVAHQASHLYLSEIKKWQRWYSLNKLRSFIANLIEDYRCNNFLINRYPGLKRDYASYLAYQFSHHKNIQDTPEIFRFLLALIQYIAFGRIKGDHTVLSKFQLEKIEKVKSILECIKWSYLFDEELAPYAEQIYRLISIDCMLQDLFDSYGDDMMISDDVVFEEREAGEYGTESKVSIGYSGKDTQSYEEKIICEFGDEFGVRLDPSEVEKRLVKDIFGVDIDDRLIDLKERRDKKIKEYFSKKPFEVHTPDEDWDFFYRCRLEVLSQVRKISTDFLFIKQAQDWEENYRTGPCLSRDFVQRLLNKDRHLFKRYIEKEADTKWLILTDVSSSVFASEVTEFTILLSEVAHTALSDHNFCICSFSNNFYIVKDFNEGYDRLVKGRIGGMYSGGTTNICDSIEFCINRLGKFPSETKVLIVITDGEPNTCKRGNPEEHTKEAVRKTFLHDIFTIAIGTQRNINVYKYFPIHFTVKSLSDFPKLFQRIYSTVLFESDRPVPAV